MNNAREPAVPNGGRESAEILEHFTKLSCDMRRESWIHGTTSHYGREILAFNELHVDEKITRYLAVLVNGDDSPIDTAQSFLQLGSEAFGIEDVLIFRLRTLVDNLERNITPCFRIVSEENLAH